MMQRRFSISERFAIRFILSGLLICFAAPGCLAAEPAPAAVAAFNSYIGAVESRLAQQHLSHDGFLASLSSSAQSEMRLRKGEFIVEQITPSGVADMPGAMLRHWRGTAFVPGATASDFERLMKDFNAYPRYYAPQVLTVKVLSRQGDHFQVVMRVRQRHIITVVMDTSYDVTFARLDARHGYSISRSTQIAEIDSPGTAGERALTSSQEHGLL
ncbi:MAG: hypothetical protein ACLQGT_10485 [Terracidiphilus sp.]